MLKYPVKLTPDDNETLLVSCPDVPEVTTFGETREEALMHAAEALQLALSFYVERGLDLPAPSRPRSKKTIYVSVPALAAAKFSLYTAFRESGIRKAELARRLGISKGNVDRLFDIEVSTRLEHLEAAFRALWKELQISVRDAASDPRAAIY